MDSRRTRAREKHSRMKTKTREASPLHVECAFHAQKSRARILAPLRFKIAAHMYVYDVSWRVETRSKPMVICINENGALAISISPVSLPRGRSAQQRRRSIAPRPISRFASVSDRLRGSRGKFPRARKKK